MPTVDGPRCDGPPHRGRRIDRTRRAVSQPVDMIRMRMREHDGVGSQTMDLPQPVGAAIDHHSTAAIGYERGRMPAMPSRPYVDLAPSPKKRQGHASASTQEYWNMACEDY